MALIGTGVGASLLDEIVRDGARQILAAALHAEVAAYIEQFADRRPRRGDFNGVNEGLGDAVITSQAVHLLIAV
jgi:hypothetical protein